MSALSLSTTNSTSPAETFSPTFFAHDTILPSFMVEERAGISICSNKSAARAGVALSVTTAAAGAAGAGGGVDTTAA
eukprot:CAMPEP_0170112548 /NCGR_PEP_ID=MMETSP0020_2-20130122/9236_1 /TAXON_ID=98059 /ORGANISM="Dinobryon sp., Strain UTEXLB2267" /LENGTH=76 /DNA_ID=CAMNT_0010338489 /DNA_START=26 /DNA_END=252 /DNA_ORIENTATION=-